MFIEPNSRLILLHDVPIDRDQTDTLYFESAGAQTSYFMGKMKRDFLRCTYQRSNRNYARVDCHASDIYDCNYMMFQNTAYGEKWFFAFVNAIDYINDNTTEVQYTIDPIQTWFFEYVTDECFIERIHSLTDNIGDNIAPEPVELGEMVYNGDFIDLFPIPQIVDNPNMVMVLWVDPDAPQSGYTIDRIFSAAKLLAYDPETELGSLKAFIEANAEHPDAIVAIYMCPAWIVGIRSGFEVTGSNTEPYPYPLPDAALKGTESLDGYIPKNKKLYTYPYNSFIVNSATGDSLNCRYEFFDNFEPGFEFYGSQIAPVSIYINPINYKNAEHCRNEKLSITGFPECAWSTDAFKAWLAQNSVPMLIKATASQANTILGGLSLDPTQGLRSQIDMVSDFASNAYSASISADITKGSFASGNAEFSNNRLCFSYNRLSVNADYAKRIDKFFTMFGYAYGEYGTPSRHHRSRFTYVKTIGCQVSGSLPADDAQYIATCYNTGIRFWADVNNVGKYYLDNAPLGS